MDARELSLRVWIDLGSGAQQPPTCQSFPVELVKQCHGVWCWAAVTVSLLETFGNNQPDGQCGIAKQVLSACTGTCTDEDACFKTSDIDVVLGVVKLKFSQVMKLDVQTVEDAIGSGDPIVAEIPFGSASSHLVIVHGYCPDSNHLIVMDPIPGWDLHDWELDLFPVQKALRVPRVQTAAAAAGPARLAARRDARLRLTETAEPEGAARLLASRLPALIARRRPPGGGEPPQAGKIETGPGVPIRLWETPEVLRGALENLSFLGWRHIVFSDGEPIMAVDLVMSGGELAFKKASRGPAVPGIATAMAKLAETEPAATDVALLEVPCLATEALWYKDVAASERFLIAFSPFADFTEQTFLRNDFTARFSARAAEERVTNQV
jgi:Peptidase_C39 like family